MAPKLPADTVFLLCSDVCLSVSFLLCLRLPVCLPVESCHRRRLLVDVLVVVFFLLFLVSTCRQHSECVLSLSLMSCPVKFNSQGLCCWNVDFCWFGLVAATHITTHHNVCVAPAREWREEGKRERGSKVGRRLLLWPLANKNFLKATKLLMKWIVMCVSISANDIPHTHITH